MTGLFSEVFFLQAIFRLYVAVTLFQMAWSGLVLWCMGAWQSGGRVRNAARKEGWAAFSDEVGLEGQNQRLLLTGQATKKIVRPAEAGVSVIICARNEAANLCAHLPVVLGQQYAGDWEVIVVDDASEDETSAVLSAFQKGNPRLRPLTLEQKSHPGKKHALAAGIRAARFENILLTDADCVPAGKHWISRMAEQVVAMPGIEIVLGYGPMVQKPDGKFLDNWTRFETAFTAMQYLTFARSGMPYMGVGRNLAFKKAIFERTGGFSAHDHIASGDDDLLVNATATRDNVAVCLHPESFVFSTGKDTWGAWLRQKKRHLAAGKAYKRQHQLWLGCLSFSHVLHYFLFFLLLVAGIGTKYVLSLWLSRLLIFFLMYRRAFSCLREAGLVSHFPIHDALLAVYYGAFVPLVLIGKKTHSWN